MDTTLKCHISALIEGGLHWHCVGQMVLLTCGA